MYNTLQTCGLFMEVLVVVLCDMLAVHSCGSKYNSIDISLLKCPAVGIIPGLAPERFCSSFYSRVCTVVVSTAAGQRWFSLDC